jgi:hypothetical protein
VELPLPWQDAYISKTSAIACMRGRFSIGAFRNGVLALRLHRGANVLVWTSLAAVSTFTAAQVPIKAPPSSPHQAEANKAKAQKEAESGSCSDKSDALADRIQEPAPRDVDGNAGKVSEESKGGASATKSKLALQASSTTDSMINGVQSDESETNVHREEPAGPNPGSPQQCTLRKGSRQTEPASPR